MSGVISLTHEPALTITMVPGHGSVTLRVEGELDASTISTFRGCVDHLDPAFREVVFDLEGLGFLDSSGIGAFVQAHREIETGLRTMKVVNASRRVRFVFDLTGLTHIIS